MSGDKLNSRKGLDDAGVFSACLGEMYRYRLAVQDQQTLLEIAVQEVRARRAQIDEDLRELLFAPSMGMDQFERQAKEINDSDMPELWQLKTQVQFMLVAVRGVYLMAGAVGERAADPSLASSIADSVRRFVTYVPDALLLRNIHELMEEYIAGGGRQRHLLKGPFDEGGIAILDKGVAYFIGRKLFLLWEIAAAAERLAAAIAQLTRDFPDEA
jgi:hypothetical protein